MRQSIDNWKKMMVIGNFPDGDDEEVASFFAVLTEKGRQFLQEWLDPGNEGLTYGPEE